MIAGVRVRSGAAGDGHSLARSWVGRVNSWSHNCYGQLGHMETRSPGLFRWGACRMCACHLLVIATRSDHDLATTHFGVIFSWGHIGRSSARGCMCAVRRRGAALLHVRKALSWEGGRRRESERCDWWPSGLDGRHAHSRWRAARHLWMAGSRWCWGRWRAGRSLSGRATCYARCALLLIGGCCMS
jgi:hypothetical protein